MLRAQNLCVARAGHSLINDLSAEFLPGQISALLGPNGSGKTTLLLTLGGVLSPTAGRVWVGERDMASLPLRERAARIGMLPQRDETVFGGSVSDFVALGGFPRGGASDQEVSTALVKMGLTARADRPLLSLSGGEYQRAHLALLMVQATDCILLDEPLRNLDLSYQKVLLEWLRERADAGAVIIVAMHELEWVGRFCDQVCLLYDDDNPHCGPLREELTRANLERLMHCTFVELAVFDRVIFIPA